MQRLFSAFPNAWPGCGLLLLRLAAGIPLLCGTAPGWAESGPAALLLRIPEGLIGTLLVIGLWTPGAAIAQALIHVGAPLFMVWPSQATLVNALLGLALSMLGPGAWSVDARLYGRRRIEV